jgi:hypothetical protein
MRMCVCGLLHVARVARVCACVCVCVRMCVCVYVCVCVCVCVVISGSVLSYICSCVRVCGLTLHVLRHLRHVSSVCMWCPVG